MSDKTILAVDGGSPVRSEPVPPRGLYGPEEKAAVVKMFDEAIATGNSIGYDGPAEQQYEKDFVEFMGGGYADGVNSGTNAVFVALAALQLDALSEVIVPPISDPGGVMPVVMVGCVPVMADADPRSFNTCAEEIEKVITERTKAIVIAHIAGEVVDMDPVMELAKKHNLYVVEDAAQAHGAKYKGRLLGTMGDIAAFSTMSGKHHCTGPQGGVVYTRNEELFQRAKRASDRGKPHFLDAPNNVYASLNCNSNDLAAAIGSVQIKKLPTTIKKRRIFGEAIKAGLESLTSLSMGWQLPDSEPVYWFLRIKLDAEKLTVDKAQFCKALFAEGVPAEDSYRHIPCEMEWFKNKAVFGNSGFPWDCSDYKGERNPNPKKENAVKAVDDHFMIYMHESYDQQVVDDFMVAFAKVENAYLALAFANKSEPALV